MARVLVGIPCFRLPDQVGRCIKSLLETPGPDVLAIDNADDEDVKLALDSFGSTIKTISSPTNEYCNGGWNRILKYGLEHEYDIIGLGSSDVCLLLGWYKVLQERAEDFKNEIWLPRIGEPSEGVEHVYGGVAGFLSFLPRKAAEIVYPIPSSFRHWHGDEYFFGKLRLEGWKVTILNTLKACHEWSSVTAVTPEVYEVIEQDKLAWEKYKKENV